MKNYSHKTNKCLTSNGGRTGVATTVKQVSVKCRSTVGRLSALILLLFALSFGFSSQAWGKTPVYLNGNFSGDNWNKTTYQISENYGATDKYYTCVIADGTTKYWRLYTNNCVSPYQENYNLNVGDNAYHLGYNGENNFIYDDVAGVIKICIDQSSDEWSPYVWLERPKVYLKTSWNGGDWSWKELTDNNDGTYTIINQYGTSSANWDVKTDGDGWEYLSGDKVTTNGNPSAGDYCLFSLNFNGGRHLTITKLTTTISLYSKSGTKIRDIQVDYGKTFDKNLLTLPADTTTAGYNFNGFYTATSSGTGIINNSLQFTANGTYGTNTNPKNQWCYIGETLNAYLQGNVRTYTITLPGETNGNVQIKYDAADKVSNTFTAPTKTGYELRGTNTFCADEDLTQPVFTKSGSLSKSESNPYITNSKWNYDGVPTIYTAWTANTYSISFDRNAGDGEETMSNLSMTYDTPKNLTKNKYTKTGYDFIGWATSAEGEKVYDDQQSVSNLTSTKDAIVPLFAKWAPHNYTISYTLNGGTNYDGAPTTYTIETPTIILGTPTKTGYNFTGWTLNDNSITEIALGTTGNLTLVANWTAKTTTITLDRQDGSATKNITATYDATLDNTQLTAADSIRTGYDFGGYKAGQTGNSAAIINSNGAGYEFPTTGDYGKSGNKWKYTEPTLTAYAYWKPHTWTITLNDNEGTGGSGTKTAKYGTTDGITSVTKPTRTDYTFAGYEDANQVLVYNADGNLLANAGTYTDADRNWIYDNNVTLYAKWNSDGNYVVTLNNQSATSAGTTSVNVKINTTTGLTASITCPEKTGYTFGGYFTQTGGNGTKLIDADGSWVIPATDYIDSESNWIYTNNVTLKANWIANKTTVSLNQQEGTGGTTQRTLEYHSTQNLGNIDLPTRAGYTFGGYFTSTNGEGTQLISAEGAWIAGVAGYTETSGDKIKWIKTTTDPLTLYAKWTPITYTITYAGNGNTGGSTANSTHTYDVEQALTANGFTRAYTVTYAYNDATDGNSEANTVANYTFANWTYNEANYSDEQPVTNLASTQDAVVTMTAQWTPASVTLPTPVKTGYQFDEWYNTGVKVGEAGASYTPEADITLTANWIEIMTAVAVSSNNTTWGTVNVANANVGVATTTTLTATHNTDYKFVSWTLTDGAILSSGQLTDATITIKGNGIANSTGTAVATFAEDLTANWYIKGDAGLLPLAGSWEKSESYRFSKPSRDASSAYIDIEITQEQVGHTYEFKLQDCGVNGEPMYGWGTGGNSRTFTQTTTYDIYDGGQANLKITPSIKGTYRFSIDWSNGQHILTVTFPTINAITASWNSWMQESNASVTEGVLTYELQVTDEQLTAENWAFKVIYGGVYYGATVSDNSITATNHSDWVLTSTNSNNIGFKPSIAGTYTFTFNSATHKLNVTYPTPATPTSINVTTERYFGEDKMATFVDNTDNHIYTDETLRLTIAEVAAPTGCTTYYQFSDNTASTERTFTITNPSTTASSIDAKVFFRPNAGGADGDTTIQTISYQGVAVPQLSLHSSLTNNEIELSQTPADITITSGASNYSGTMDITCDDEAWKNNVSATNTTHNVQLSANIHTYKYVATGSANGRTFTASLSVSVYQLVTVRVKDANPAWAKNFYMWDSATGKQNSAWPGETLTQKVGDWYIFSVKYPAYDQFVINDGETTGKQTIDLSIPSADICYEIGAEDHATDGKHIYACTQAAQCPNGLFVGTIANVDMYNGENKMVSPLVQLDPSLNVENLQISFSYSQEGIVTADQRGTAINLTATQVGSTTVTATYSIAGAESVSQTFTVNVTAAILIQIEYGDLGWGPNHDNTYIHFKGEGLTETWALMTYKDNVDGKDRYYARIPLGTDGKVTFQVGYPNGESWYDWNRKSNEVTVSESKAYEVTVGTVNINRILEEKGSSLWTEYQVEVDMNNGIVYYSNKITDLSETVSFFAPGYSETLSYKKGSVRIMRNGEQADTIAASEFDSSYVYTAKITDGMGLSNIQKYRGNYYIRTDAATATASGDDFSDGWNDYKQTSHAFIEISLYEGARYNYYWICNCKRKNDAGNLNIKARVGNEYNSDLAGMITNDTYTFGDGYITPDANGVNLRFGYNPNDNHFERSILRGSSDDLFLNVIGENIYNEQGCSTLLNEANANSKLIDKSNWVYEKVVYASITDDKPSAEVLLKSTAFNGTTVYQLGYTLDDQGKTTSTPAEHTIMASGTGQNTYELRLIYDYKTNRLTSAWAPSKLEVDGEITINSDIMFVQHENDTVSQITMKTDASKVKSLEYQLFVMEVEQDTIHVNDDLNFEHYYISLPFDCYIKDIYGIEGYLEYWGLQRYDGEERARKGWFEEDTPEGFWRWMDRSEKLNAGEGYLLSVAKGWLHEDNMFKEFDGKSALRLYFPSSKKGFDLSKSSASDAQEYTPWICNIASRKGQDSNWRMIGSTAYNTIKTGSINAEDEGASMEAAKYLYDIVVDTTRNEQGKITALTERYVAVDGSGYKYAPFKGYMYQFGGTINWQQYTRGTDELAPRRMPVRASQKMCLNVLENNSKVAHTFVELNENATANFDMNIDLAYLASGTTRLYTSDGETDYAANVLNFDNHLIPVVINPSHDGTYTFHMDNTGDVAVYLVDNVKNTKTLLSAGDVAVELEKGSSAARFALEVNVRATPTDFFNAEGNIDSVNGQKTQKLLDNGVLYLIRDGHTYDAQGRQVK